MKWSDGSEPLRFRVVAEQCSAPVQPERVAWRRKAPPPGCRWICPVALGRVYRNRGARQQLLVTAGNSDAVCTGWSGAVRGRYKLCES